MLHFFSNLPPLARFGLILGGSMISAFSSKLPEALQEIGLLLGIAIAALGIVATVWHWLSERRIKSGKGKLVLEPSTLLPAFAIIALVGVLGVLFCIAWTHFGGRPNVSAVETTKLARPLEDQISDLTRQLAEAKSTPKSTAGPGALYAPGSSAGRLRVDRVVGAIPRIVEDHGIGNHIDIGETNDGSAPLTPLTPLPWPGTEFSKMSNTELKKLAVTNAMEMRALATEWVEKVRNRPTELGLMQAREEVNNKFIEKFRGTGTALVAEILARQKIFPPYEYQVRSIYPGALEGRFAGVNPITEASVFLEDRARMLPDD